MNQQLEVIKTLVAGIFRNAKGEPYKMTTGQAKIFLKAIDPHYKWLWISAPTRYGKSEILAMALLYLAAFHNLKIPIVGGSEDKANKIMEYIVQHIPDNPKLYAALINVDFSEIEKLKVTVSKDALRWYSGGWIFITSIDSRSISKEGEKVVGEGGDIIVLEEAGLIKNKDQFSKVVRMSEEDRGWGKMIMSGNCVEGSVFEDAWNDPMFEKVRIDLEQAIAESRFTRESLEQKKTLTTTKDWKRYYLVEFPLANEFTYFKPKKYEMLPDDLEFFGFLDLALGKVEVEGEAEKKGKKSLVAIVVLGRSKSTGQVYEVYNFGQIIKPNDTINKVFSLPFTFQRFGIEAVQFQRFFYQVIEEKSKELKKYIPFEPVQQKRNKMERIEGMEPFINTGQILFSQEGELYDEMQDYPKCEHFDVLDALEGAWRVMGGSGFEFAIV